MALMAKRVRRPSDPTVAASLEGGQTVASPLGGGQTTALPNTKPTDKVELAWSTGEDLGGDLGEDFSEVHEGEPREEATGQSWSATLRIAGLLVVAGLVLAGAIVLGRWMLATDNSPTKAAPSPAPTTLTSAEPANSATTGATSTSIASSPDQDNRYIQALNNNKIPIANIDQQQIITAAKVVCQHLAAGWTVPQTVEDFRKTNEENAPLANRAADFVNVSIQAYCPQRAR
jgi:Protein of unknown function (DUF732)